MKLTDIDTIEKFIIQAHDHLPYLSSVECVEVSNFFLTFRLRDSSLDTKALIKLAKCSKMRVEVKAGSRIGIKFAIGLCVTGWQSTDKEYAAEKLSFLGYTCLILTN